MNSNVRVSSVEWPGNGSSLGLSFTLLFDASTAGHTKDLTGQGRDLLGRNFGSFGPIVFDDELFKSNRASDVATLQNTRDLKMPYLGNRA